MKTYTPNMENVYILKEKLSLIVNDLNLYMEQDRYNLNVLRIRIKGVDYIEECSSHYLIVVMYRNIKLLSSGVKLYGEQAYTSSAGKWVNELNIIQHRTPDLTAAYHGNRISDDWVIKFLKANKGRIEKIRKEQDIKNKEMFERNRERELKNQKLSEMEKLEIDRLVQKNKDEENEKLIIAEKRRKGAYKLKTVICPRCHGDGGLNGGCSKCDGKGYIEQI